MKLKRPNFSPLASTCCLEGRNLSTGSGSKSSSYIWLGLKCTNAQVQIKNYHEVCWQCVGLFYIREQVLSLMVRKKTVFNFVHFVIVLRYFVFSFFFLLLFFFNILTSQVIPRRSGVTNMYEWAWMRRVELGVPWISFSLQSGSAEKHHWPNIKAALLR